MKDETGSHWDWDVGALGKLWIAVDFHHTVTTLCPVCKGMDRDDADNTGELQPGCVEALNKLRKRYRILIFTGSGHFWGVPQRQSIIDWLNRHGVPYDEIRFDKPPYCFSIDDRNIHHRGWTATMKEIEKREKPLHLWAEGKQ